MSNTRIDGPNVFTGIACGFFTSNIVFTSFVCDSETEVGRQCRSCCQSVPDGGQYISIEVIFYAI